MNPNIIFLIMLVGMMALMFFMQRSQKKQAQKRMESLNKLQKGYEVITIGGLYGTVDEVDTEKRTVVLDVLRRMRWRIKLFIKFIIFFK